MTEAIKFDVSDEQDNDTIAELMVDTDFDEMLKGNVRRLVR